MIKTVNNPKGLSSKLTFGSREYQRISHFLLVSFPYLPSFRPYNITISHENTIVWFRVAKVGTRTILDTLQKAGIKFDAEHPYDCHYPKSKYKAYFKFAFVRNPFDRLVSCWQNKVVKQNYFKFPDDVLLKMQDFSQFISFVEMQNIESCDPHLRLQSKLIDLNEINFLGRFESFEDDLKYVLNKLDVVNYSIHQINSTKNRLAYKDYYNENLKFRVTKIYERDLNIFSYRY